MSASTYIDNVAHEIQLEVASDLVPSEHARELFLIYAVLALSVGESVTRRNVHDAWSAWMAKIDPQHESIRPYEELPPDVREEDDPFVAAIRAVARRQPGHADQRP